jgi:hypothetical protein
MGNDTLRFLIDICIVLLELNCDYARPHFFNQAIPLRENRHTGRVQDLSVHLYRGLQRSAGVRVDLTVQRNFFELWCGPLHGLCPFENNTNPVLLSLD